MRRIQANYLALVVFLCVAIVSSSAQFLFTYEINPENDSRAPKSTLFDPSSFKIVTPSQLQSSYQKISAQLDAAVAAQSPPPPPVQVENDERVAAEPELTTTARSSNVEQPSLLKQTSAALQSFADLFSLSSPAASSSPSPLVNLPNVHHQANTVNQEAEARSLHEHWTQQQQRSHQLPAHHQHQQQPALNPLFTTSSSNSVQQPQQQPQPSQASYWLTASPLNPPDGNYLVQVKQQQTDRQNVGPQAQLMDSLLAVGQQRQPRSSNKPLPISANNLAQTSFLQSTPTSYYPSAGSVESSTRASLHHQHQQQPPQQSRSFEFSSTPLSTGTGPRMGVIMHTTMPSVQPPQPQPIQSAPVSMPVVTPLSQQLQPPANIPENFVHSNLNKQHKSAEESLISYRQQQQLSQQHDQQNQVFAAQQQLANGQAHQAAPQPVQQPQLQQPQLQQPQVQQPQQVNDIPKISPAIYESFLLQQKDQHEKHMELLKQQQEINKLLEQKQKQHDAAEARRRKKKEEQEKEARKKALRDQEAAKRAKLEAEERELRRRREEEDRKRREEEERRKLEEERRYREYLEAREREKRQREEEEERRQLKLKQEQQEREAAELAEKEKVAAEEERKKKAEETKYLNYLRQQEELKKLLELKQKEDEAIQQRRKQVALQQQQQAPQRNQASRARSLAQEHKDRAGSGSWGAPIRSVRLPTSTQQQDLTSTSPMAPTTTSFSTTTTTTTTTQAPEQTSTTRRRFSSKKQRTLGDERLIRQKIPNYSGPGQYGLYRGNGGANDTIGKDLAALLDSVTLPSTSTSTTTSTTTPAPAEPTTRRFHDTSSSLSPLLDRSLSLMSSTAPPPSEPFFDDDVPRRPVRLARERSLPQPRPSAGNQLTAASSPSRQQTASRFNESLAVAPTAKPGPQRAHIGLASLPPDADNDGIPGRAGQEYPVLSSVPPTSFSCNKQPLNGYYADTETACQVVHLCQGGVQSSILCPNGTIFNQEKFSCQWWYEVNCSRAPMFYQLNDNLYKALPGSSAASAPTSDKDSEVSEKKKASTLLRKQANLLAAS